MIDQTDPRIETPSARIGNDAMVFDIIRAANSPLSAYDILDRLKPTRPRIAPPTVYRALEIDPTTHFLDFSGRPVSLVDKAEGIREIL